jgi:group I intron endonuclease
MKKKATHGYVYVLTCLITMKEYVGQASCWKTRWKNHCNSANKGCLFLLHAAMRKHGIENFAITIVRRCYSEELNYWEEYYIEEFDTLGPQGYNMTIGGDGVRGAVRSEATTARHKASMIKFYEDNPGARAEMSAFVKAAFSKRPGLLRRLNAAKRGRSTSRKGTKLGREWCAKLSDGQLRRFQDPDQRRIRSETAKAAYDKDLTLRARTGANSRLYWQNISDEDRARISAERSERTKALWAEGRLRRS